MYDNSIANVLKRTKTITTSIKESEQYYYCIKIYYRLLINKVILILFK